MAFLEEMMVVASRPDANRLRMVNAFVKLLGEADYDDVSVQDICKACGMSRQTFYRHFSSKHEIASWFWDLIASVYILKVGVEYDWHESFLLNFEAAQPYFPFFVKASAGHALDGVRAHASALRKEVLLRTLEEGLGVEITPQLAFEAGFFCAAEALVRFDALEQEGLVTPEQRAAALTACVPSGLRRVVDEGVAARRVANGLPL